MKRTRFTRYTAAQREAFLTAFANSNQSAQAFAREHQIANTTLSTWRNARKKSPPTKPPRKIVPLVLEPVARELALANGRTLRFRASLDTANILADRPAASRSARTSLTRFSST